jgi:hypothetical protein
MFSFLSTLILASCLLKFSKSCNPDANDCTGGQVCARNKWKFWQFTCKDPIYVGENQGCYREYKCKEGLQCQKKVYLGVQSVCKKIIIGEIQEGKSCRTTSECKSGLKCLMEEVSHNAFINIPRLYCKSKDSSTVAKAVTSKTGLTDYSDI